MQNLRLLFLGGLFLILCTKNVNSMEQLTPAQEHTRVTDIGNAIVGCIFYYPAKTIDLTKLLISSLMVPMVYKN